MQLALAAVVISAALASSPGIGRAQSPGAPASLAELRQAIASAVERYPVEGEYAAAITDLQTGETISVNGERPQLAACSINFFLLVQVVADVEAGRYPESSVGDLIAQTVYSSNPVTAHELYRIVGNGDVIAGARRVADRIRSMGLDQTVLDHPPAYAEDSLHPNPYDWNNWMTALDTNAALGQLYSGRLLAPQRQEYLLTAMTKVKAGLNYLTAYVPGSDATVSHKNGFGATTDGKWMDNDIGIVRFQRGDRTYAYAISFFSQWVPDKYADIPLGQAISALAWNYFSHRYP